MAAFTFDPERHLYRVGSEIIPSVTQILKLSGLVDYDSIPPAVLNYAAERGTAVHAACQFWDEGDLDRSSLDPIILPYLSAWQNFVVDHGFETLASEQRYLGELRTLKFGMTLDRLVMMDRRKTILDIKCTRKIERSHAVQLAGYAIGLESSGTAVQRVVRYRRLVVQLSPEGTYQPYEFTDPEDAEIFAAALRIAHWKMASIRSQIGPTT